MKLQFMSIKLLVAIFFLGILTGFSVSPFIESKPKDIFLSPVSTSQATINFQQPKKKISLKHKIKRMDQLFKEFDQEQSNYQVNNKNNISKIHNQNTNIISNKYGHKTIALIGDSMIDTMGTNLPYLQKQLKQYYPNMNFTMLNYGIGAQTAPMVLNRINNQFNYKDRHYPPILQSNADIFIVGSNAYNPIDNISEYTNAMNNIIQTIKSTGKPVYLLTTIAPIKSKFGMGPGGVNWDTNTAWNHATKIQEYLEKSLTIASTHNIPAIDAYHSTLQANGEGITTYINKHDGIHPSVAGHNYIANVIARKLKIN